MHPMGYWPPPEDCDEVDCPPGMMDGLGGGTGMDCLGWTLASRFSRASLMAWWSGLKLANDPARKREDGGLSLNASSYSPIEPPYPLSD